MARNKNCTWQTTRWKQIPSEKTKNASDINSKSEVAVGLGEAVFRFQRQVNVGFNLTSYDMHKNCDICTEYFKISVQKPEKVVFEK